MADRNTLTLFVLHECDEVLAMTRKEWGEMLDRGETMAALMSELGPVEVPSRTWVVQYLRKNYPHFLNYILPFKVAARKEA